MTAAVMKCNYFINFAEKPEKIQLHFLGEKETPIQKGQGCSS